MLARQRPSTTKIEEFLDGLLSGADQAMVNAFTTGFRVAQVKTAISKSIRDEAAAAAALESAQIVALAILVREAMAPAQFEVVYRPFATVLPGPDARQPAPIDQQIAAFLRFLPGLKGDDEDEVSRVAKVLSERPKLPAAPAATVVAAPPALDPAANYATAWKDAIAAAVQIGRSQAFRVAQDTAEQAAPHDGLGIVGFAGVAAGAIFMRDVLPIEKVLLLYEPFSAALPYEKLGG